MKKLLVGLSLLALSATASADFFGGNNGEWKMGPNGPYYEESDWPEWTPMYWMDEMMDNFDDEEDFGGGMPFSGGMPGMMPYGGAPMGYGAAPMMPPMGYGAAPMMAPMPQMGAPMPQMGAPMMAPMPQMSAPMMAPPAMPAIPAAPGATPGPAAN
ncbi:MAG: hypothetical protein KJ914_08820 [Gammaproteobacteria bacterium]|nr:hypothetical protein [Gammaproteobacteria bacterium]MBU1723098.1 hypothetical protein [Gammaproteobacteria bacterium]MBU2007399.1 hypothetical protein [Gammaproteobacteria bacterium]